MPQPYDALTPVTNMVAGAKTTRYVYAMTGDLQNAATPSIWAYATVTSSYDAGVTHLGNGLSLQQPSGAWTNGVGYDLPREISSDTAHPGLTPAWRFWCRGASSRGYLTGRAQRLQSVVSPAGTHTYTYNGPGNIWTNLALPLAGAHVGKSLDSVARLNSTALVSYWGTNLNYHGYTNNVAGQRIAQVRTDGSYVVYGYDNDGQLQSAVGSGGQSTENLGYQYDVCQNLNTRTNGGATTGFTKRGQLMVLAYRRRGHIAASPGPISARGFCKPPNQLDQPLDHDHRADAQPPVVCLPAIQRRALGQ